MERLTPSDSPPSTPVRAPPEGVPSNAAAPSSRVTVQAFSAPLRAASIVLYVAAALNLVNLAEHIALDMFQGTQSAPPLSLALTLATFTGGPLLVVGAFRRLVTATLEVQPSSIVLTMRRARLEIPAASIRAIQPLGVPLPGPGISFSMTSGRRLRYRLVLANPDLLIDALAHGPIEGAVAARRHPALLYAAARRSLAPRRWYWAALKLVVLPVALSVVLFRLHQMIGYGGAFGQYYLLGLKSYLTAFVLTCTGTTCGLWVYAALCRLFGESFALVATRLVPSGARAVRVLVEGMCLIAYYGLVPAYVAVALLA